jgi:MATE family multidrug resistance protein
MKSAWQALKLELPPMARLAGPVVLAELGWMTMGVVDTIMVGHVSPAAMGAVSLGGVLFYTVAVIGTGMMLGLDTLVSQSFGAGDVMDCHRSLLNSVYLCVPLSLALMRVVWLFPPFLRSFGIDPVVLHDVIPFLHAIGWSIFPLLLYFAFRRYLQGMNLVKPVMFALLSANLMNLAVDWILVFGKLGAPPMGAEGAGWATCLSRVYMSSVLLAYIFYHERRFRTGWRETPFRPDLVRIRRLIGLGLPAAMQLSVEVGVFAAVTTLIGKLGADALAAHQIAMNAASFTYMVPLGIGAAAAVRVGQALGRGDVAAASRAGWTATLMGGGFMSLAGIVFLVAPGTIVRIYTPDPKVLQLGVTLLAVAAAFQLFDGVQTVITGALRGAGDTRTPMLCHLLGYWALGFPLGYVLCFRLNWGVPGLWAGLCLALIVIGSVLMMVWWKKVKSFARTGSLRGKPRLPVFLGSEKPTGDAGGA